MDNRKYYLKLLEQELMNDKILEKIRNLKYYLLSDEEKRLINIYLKDKRLINYKKSFIKIFINRLKKLNDDRFLYYYSNLIKVCPLNIELNLKNGVVKNIDLNMPVNTSKVTGKPESYSKDIYFTNLIESNDYENLYKYYDLETIEKNSNIRGMKWQ